MRVGWDSEAQDGCNCFENSYLLCASVAASDEKWAYAAALCGVVEWQRTLICVEGSRHHVQQRVTHHLMRLTLKPVDVHDIRGL